MAIQIVGDTVFTDDGSHFGFAVTDPDTGLSTQYQITPEGARLERSVLEHLVTVAELSGVVITHSQG